MPRSMTGYGVGKFTDDGLGVFVELRSVNNRFLDFNFKLPKTLFAREQDLRDLIKSRLSRGRITVIVNEEWSDSNLGEIKTDLSRARKYVQVLRNAKSELNLEGEITIGHLISLDALFSSGDDDEYQEKLWHLTAKATQIALDMLIKVSQQEADNLLTDIKERLTLICQEAELIKSYAQNQTALYRDKLNLRLQELINKEQLDPSRLEGEVAIMADKLDISEEIVRLDSHIKLFNETLNEDKPIGKALNFILQEMGREINTIGSKCFMVEIAQAVMRIKEIQEQMREQVQNLE